ncbi:MAG: ArsR family transcriptional regulator [Bacteroidales bacterium]|nr:ArsR family transcriptional regulator [Bacteroidales bacterium]
MEVEKGQTYKYLREKYEIPVEVKEQLKNYTKIKKAILDALRDHEMTIAQISELLSLSRHEVVYYLMSLIKYGFVQAGELDEMDEYYMYKRLK